MATAPAAVAPTLTGRFLRRSMETTPASADPQLSAIRAAQEAAEIVLGELLHRSDNVITAEDMAALQPEIELARFTVHDCQQKEIDLLASATVVTPPDPATLGTLQTLAESIDNKTVRNEVVAATVDGLASILNSAVRITAML